MADKTIEELTRRIEALEKKYCEVNFPYQKPPYPCVVESVYTIENFSTKPSQGLYLWRREAFLMSDGQIKFATLYAYDQPAGSYSTPPTTLARMAERAGVEIAPADMKKKTVVTPLIFKKFGGMKYAYMGEFMVSDGGDLFAIKSETATQELDAIERLTAELGSPFKREPSVSEWDNIKAGYKAFDIAKDKAEKGKKS